MTPERIEQLTTFYEKTNPLCRNTTADDVALAAFNLLEGSMAITGQILLIDSGDHLHTNVAPKA